MDNPMLRALVIGLVLAIGGIGLFMLLYFVVLSGFSAVIRLFGSLIAPPFVMFLLVGGYYILTQDENE